jgi:hypothetical protein
MWSADNSSRVIYCDKNMQILVFRLLNHIMSRLLQALGDEHGLCGGSLFSKQVKLMT